MSRAPVAASTPKMPEDNSPMDVPEVPDDDLQLDVPEVRLGWKFQGREPKRSSVFQFNGGSFRLCYGYRGSHHVGLQLMSHSCQRPFHASLQVQVTGHYVKELSQVTRFATKTTAQGRQPYYSLIWRKGEDEILRAEPGFSENKTLKVYVVLKVGVPQEGPAPGRAAIDSCVSLTAKLLPFITSFCEDYRKLLAMNSNACLSSLSQDLSKLLDQIPEPDVEFQCSGQSMRAHGVVLSARSEVIASLLACDTVDVEGRTKVIKVPNMFPDVFQHFLRYIYSGQLPELTVELALRLYEVGDRYAVKGLTKRCSTFLLEHLSVVNACDVLVVANDHGDRDFKESVVRFMVDKRVPKEYSSWMEFCGGNPTLAVEVLNRFCNVVSQSPASLQQKA